MVSRASQEMLALSQRELGLSPFATEGDCKKAFKKLAFAHHPDRNPDCVEASTKKFQAINSAYAYLTSEAAAAFVDREREAAAKKREATAAQAKADLESGTRAARLRLAAIDDRRREAKRMANEDEIARAVRARDRRDRLAAELRHVLNLAKT